MPDQPVLHRMRQAKPGREMPICLEHAAAPAERSNQRQLPQRLGLQRFTRADDSGVLAHPLRLAGIGNRPLSRVAVEKTVVPKPPVAFSRQRRLRVLSIKADS